MVHFCCVPSCSSNSFRESHLSFFSLPRKDKILLKQWIYKIGRKNLSLGKHTRVCSKHFVNANKRLLRPDEVPTLELPQFTTVTKQRKPPMERSASAPVEEIPIESPQSAVDQEELTVNNVHIQTELEGNDIESLEKSVPKLECMVKNLKFSLSNVSKDDSKLCFYTGFLNYAALKACYYFLGSAVNSLMYGSSKDEGSTKKRCRRRSLTPEDEFLLVLVRLRLGLMEQDLAHRFEISQSTVSRIIITWINFLYVKFREIPIWPPRELVYANMPKQFRKLYPTTRVIIDATEIFISQPRF